jgi:hypothetical protein
MGGQECYQDARPPAVSSLRLQPGWRADESCPGELTAPSVVSVASVGEWAPSVATSVHSVLDLPRYTMFDLL